MTTLDTFTFKTLEPHCVGNPSQSDGMGIAPLLCLGEKVRSIERNLAVELIIVTLAKSHSCAVLQFSKWCRSHARHLA